MEKQNATDAARNPATDAVVIVREYITKHATASERLNPSTIKTDKVLRTVTWCAVTQDLVRFIGLILSVAVAGCHENRKALGRTMSTGCGVCGCTIDVTGNTKTYFNTAARERWLVCDTCAR